MPETVSVFLNGKELHVSSEGTVAAAVFISGESSFRRSVTGQPRGPLCGMGVCFECRVTVDGVPHVKSCQMLCRQGMRINTHG